MVRSPELPAPSEGLPAGLAAYQQALWGLPARLVVLADEEVRPPILTGGPEGLPGSTPTLHLPRASMALSRRWAEAVVSHAAAHQRFGAVPQARAGLKPVQQALYGVLEDARVEALACAELPGLRGLWQGFHAGPDALQGLGFEALLARLARVLLDPGWHDPHPWVQKVRRGVQGPDGQGLLRATPATLRQSASVLGHDIGQMRLPFNPRTYCPHPTYRDDNQHLWCWDPDLPPSDLPLQGEAVQGSDGISRCALVLDAEIIRTEPAPRRPFQGWRYLAADEAPRDLPQGRAADDTLPPELARALAEIGLR